MNAMIPKPEVHKFASRTKITMLFCLLFFAVSAQSDLAHSGKLTTVQYTGSPQDFLIPESSPTVIRFEIKGGDGGRAVVTDSASKVAGFKTCESSGGAGARIIALFAIGTGAGELRPGSTIRFIVGGRGRMRDLASVIGGTAAGGGGGGGGTAVLYRAKGSNDWTILAVAGGGGGAYQGVVFGSCQDGSRGGYGRAVTNGGSGKGSLSGNGGSNGGGGITGKGKGGSDTEGLTGEWAGGNGGSSGVNGSDGGYGFGGGGASDESAGGGGGGSYVNPDLTVEQMIMEDPGGEHYEDGSIQYAFNYYGFSQTFRPAPSGMYASEIGKDLHVKWLSPDSGSPDGSPIHLWDRNVKNPTYNELWYYDAGTGTIRLLRDPNKCIDLSNGNTANGTAITIYTCNGTTSQQWVHDYRYYLLLNKDQNKCLTLKQDNFEDGNSLQIWDCNATDEKQKVWRF